MQNLKKTHLEEEFWNRKIGSTTLGRGTVTTINPSFVVYDTREDISLHYFKFHYSNQK